MNFDVRSQRMVMSGGTTPGLVPFGDTWEYTGTPAITIQPASIAVTTGTEAIFNVGVSGIGPYTYQWRHGGQEITDDGRVTGGLTATLRIASAQIVDSGAYVVEVRSSCGSTFSREARLDVGVGCLADFNEDGGVDGLDVEAFFAAWESNDPRADINQDGGIDGSDVGAFFEFWESGC